MFILNILFNSLFFFLLTILIYSLGERVNKFLSFHLNSYKDRYFNIPLNLISGLYTLSLVFTLLFFFWSINKLSSYLVIILLLIFSFKEILRTGKKIHLSLSNKKNLFYLFVSYLILYIYFIQLSLPEIKWDALAYHLLSPGATEVSFSHNFGFYNSLPKGLDVLFWLGNILSDQYFLPKYFHFIFFFTLLIFVGVFTYNYISKRYFLIPVFLLFINQIALEYAASSYIDFGNSSLEIFSLIFIYLFILKKELTYLIWCLAFLSYAVSIKYTSLMASISIFIVLSVYVIFFKIKLSNLIKEIKLQYLLQILFFLILPVIYFLKNWILLENPLWPFYFGHEGMSDIDYKSLIISNLQSFTFDKSLYSYLLLPIRILTGNFESYSLSSYNDLIENFTFKNLEIGMLCLLLSLIFITLNKNKKLYIYISLFVFFTFTVNFFFGSHQVRYILSSFLVLSFFPIFLIDFRGYKTRTIESFKFLSVLLIILVILSSKISAIEDKIRYFNPKGRDQFLLNLHDYDLNLMLIEKNISTKEVAYPFELNSYRYFKDFEDLRNSYSFGLGISDNTEKDILILKQNNIKYWITNSMTTNWRRDWLENPFYEDSIRLNHLIQLDEEILAKGKVILTRGTNTLVELPEIK